MDTDFLAALDRVDGRVEDGKMTSQAFSPPRLSSSQLTQLELLQHLSLYSELLIIVCADKGMGKTFIAKALFAAREVPDQSLMFEADVSLSYLDIMHNLAQFLDLADLADDIDGIEQQVVSQCLQISEEEQGSVLLIIDQAEQLSDEVLENINQLALLAPNALHIMLLAPLGFDNELLALSEPHAPFHMMEIEPLTDDEAAILLLEQFPQKEWKAEQTDYIVQQSAGNPGKILYLAEKLLSGFKSPQETLETQKFPVMHAAAIALVAIILIGAYIYQKSSPALITSPLGQKSEVIAFEPAIAKEGLQIKENIVVVPDTEKVESVEEVDFNFPQADSVDSVQNTDSNNVVLDQPLTDTPALNELVEPQKVEVNYSKDEQALMSASNSAFVIQLFGSYSAENAQVFMNANETSAMKLLRYEAQYNGKPWYVVIAGPFESREKALLQSKELTAKLRNQKPWVRPVSAIQLVLKNRS
ncbi:MAG: DamX protein [Oleispira sp.]|jgi:DamX protein